MDCNFPREPNVDTLTSFFVRSTQRHVPEMIQRGFGRGRRMAAQKAGGLYESNPSRYKAVS
jgi:hypothetical protein